MNKEQLIELLKDEEVMSAIKNMIVEDNDLKKYILDTVEDRLGDLTTLREYNEENILNT